MNKTALVTGGAGFIGSHLVEYLLVNGWEVRVLDSLSTGSRENLSAVEKKINFIQGSVTDVATVAQAVTGADVIFHLAAKVFVPESFEIPAEYEHVNVQGTAVLLAAAMNSGVKRMVFSSTCAVYGDITALPIAETAPTKPLSPYASNKLAAEEMGRQAAQAGGPAFTALRYFNVYGPRQNPRSAYSGVISRFADALRKDEQPMIYGDGRQTRDFIYVGDVVRANLLAALQPGRVSSVFNIGTGHETSVNSLFALMAQARKSQVKPAYLPSRPGDILRSVADVSKARNEMAFSASPVAHTRLPPIIVDP